MIVVALTEEDLPEIVALEQCFPVKQRWSEAAWREEIVRAHGVALGAKQGSDLVGVLALNVLDDVAELYRIVVAPPLRRRGVADCLLAAGLERVGPRRTLLEVGQDNASALALYRKHGFVTIDRRKDYYAPGDDALILERDWKDVDGANTA